MESESSSDLITKIKRMVMELRSKGKNVDEEEQVLILLEALPSSYEPMIRTLSSNVKLNKVIERLHCQDKLKTPGITKNVSFCAKRYSKSSNHKFSTNNRLQRECYNCSGYRHFADVCPSSKKEKVNNSDHEEKNDKFSNVIVFSLGDKSNDFWIVDLGATTHITGNLKLLRNVTKHPEIRVKAANRSSIYSNKAGEAVINNVLIKNIYYSPEVDANLLS